MHLSKSKGLIFRSGADMTAMLCGGSRKPFLFQINNQSTMSSSVGANCTELKQKYDNCFNKWYSEKFLKGDTTPECEELFKDYRACVMVSRPMDCFDLTLNCVSRQHWKKKVLTSCLTSPVKKHLSLQLPSRTIRTSRRLEQTDRSPLGHPRQAITWWSCFNTYTYHLHVCRLPGHVYIDRWSIGITTSFYNIQNEWLTTFWVWYQHNNGLFSGWIITIFHVLTHCG